MTTANRSAQRTLPTDIVIDLTTDPEPQAADHIDNLDVCPQEHPRFDDYANRLLVFSDGDRFTFRFFPHDQRPSRGEINPTDDTLNLLPRSEASRTSQEEIQRAVSEITPETSPAERRRILARAQAATERAQAQDHSGSWQFCRSAQPEGSGRGFGVWAYRHPALDNTTSQSSIPFRPVITRPPLNDFDLMALVDATNLDTRAFTYSDDQFALFPDLYTIRDAIAPAIRHGMKDFSEARVNQLARGVLNTVSVEIQQQEDMHTQVRLGFWGTALGAVGTILAAVGTVVAVRSITLMRQQMDLFRQQIDLMRPVMEAQIRAMEGGLREGQSALEAFGRDLTLMAREGRLGPVLGREAEIQALVDALGKRLVANPLLVGPPGSGKTAIVEGFVQRLVRGEVAGFDPANTRVVELNLGSIIAGGGVVGTIEARVHKILAELGIEMNDRGEVTSGLRTGERLLVFIDEVHMANREPAKGTPSVAHHLKPALSRGLLSLIGATTNEEVHLLTNPDGSSDSALGRRFERIEIRAMSPEDTVTILGQNRATYERDGIRLSDEAIQEAVRLTERLVPDQHFPDKAIQLVDYAVSRAVRLGQSLTLTAGDILQAQAQRMGLTDAGLSLELDIIADAIQQGHAELIETRDTVLEESFVRRGVSEAEIAVKKADAIRRWELLPEAERRVYTRHQPHYVEGTIPELFLTRSGGVLGIPEATSGVGGGNGRGNGGVNGGNGTGGRSGTIDPADYQLSWDGLLEHVRARFDAEAPDLDPATRDLLARQLVERLEATEARSSVPLYDRAVRRMISMGVREFIDLARRTTASTRAGVTPPPVTVPVVANPPPAAPAAGNGAGANGEPRFSPQERGRALELCTRDSNYGERFGKELSEGERGEIVNRVLRSAVRTQDGTLDITPSLIRDALQTRFTPAAVAVAPRNNGGGPADPPVPRPPSEPPAAGAAPTGGGGAARATPSPQGGSTPAAAARTAEVREGTRTSVRGPGTLRELTEFGEGYVPLGLSRAFAHQGWITPLEEWAVNTGAMVMMEVARPLSTIEMAFGLPGFLMAGFAGGEVTNRIGRSTGIETLQTGGLGNELISLAAELAGGVVYVQTEMGGVQNAEIGATMVADNLYAVTESIGSAARSLWAGARAYGTQVGAAASSAVATVRSWGPALRLAASNAGRVMGTRLASAGVTALADGPEPFVGDLAAAGMVIWAIGEAGYAGYLGAIGEEYRMDDGEEDQGSRRRESTGPSIASSREPTITTRYY